MELSEFSENAILVNYESSAGSVIAMGFSHQPIADVSNRLRWRASTSAYISATEIGQGFAVAKTVLIHN
jgi:hypothetical protein